MKSAHAFECKGFSLLETALVLALMAGLYCPMKSLFFPRCDLTAIQADFEGAISQAKILARARGTNVTVALGVKAASSDVLPLALPPRVKWGKPSSVQTNPTGMRETVNAAETGEAHQKIVVTPYGTAQATAWFLNDGKDVLCMRLSDKCRVQIWRWVDAKKIWKKVK